MVQRVQITVDGLLNAICIAYCLLTPLLVIPVAGLLGTSDFLFIPALGLTILMARQLQRPTPAHWILFFFLILVGLSLVRMEDWTYFMKYVRLIGILFPFFLVLTGVGGQFDRYLNCFLWSGMLSIGIGIVLWQFDLTLFEEEANQRIWIAGGESRNRASGLFGNSGAYGSLIAVWAVACGLNLFAKQEKKYVPLIFVILFTLGGLFASSSRSAALATIAGWLVGAVVYTVFVPKDKGISVSKTTVVLATLAGVAIVGLGLGAVFIVDEALLQSTLSRFNPFDSEANADAFLSGRVSIWDAYIREMDQWALMGVGYKQGHLYFDASPHNQFLAAVAECGLATGAVLIVFIITTFLFAIKLAKWDVTRGTVGAGVMVAFAADGMGGEPIGSWQITPVTMLILGIVVCAAHEVDHS